MPGVSSLEAWRTFYQIVGASAGALTGLQFVVVALSAQSPAMRRTEGSILAFGSPTVVHFCAVLLMAGILTAPWHSLAAPGVALALAGAAGIGYTVIVVGRARLQSAYRPVVEDWLWHAVFPAAAYGTLLLTAVSLPDRTDGALLWLGGVSLLLLFTGIHNAWDAAAYISLGIGAPKEEQSEEPAQRLPAKKADSSAPHSDSSTPPTTSTR